MNRKIVDIGPLCTDPAAPYSAGMPPMKMRALAKSRAFSGSVVEMFEPPPPLITQKQLEEDAGAPDSPHAQARAHCDSPQWAALREESPQRTSSSPTSALYKQFACPKCGKSYQKEASLNFHLRYVLAAKSLCQNPATGTHQC